MTRGNRLKRARMLLWILEDAEGGQATHELASRLSVSERTVRRDLTALRTIGYPLVSVAGLWHLVEGMAVPAALAIDDACQADERDKVMAIEAAIAARRPIMAHHNGTIAPHEPIRIRLSPLRLRHLDGSLFLIGREHPQGRLRTAAVERLTQVTRIEGRVSPEAGKGLGRYVKHGFAADATRELLRVDIRFAQQVAWRVQERVWHPSQRVHCQPDGSAIVTVRVPGFAWVKAWVLGFGPAALVLSPKELIRQVCADLELAAAAYCAAADKVAQLDLFGHGK